MTNTDHSTAVSGAEDRVTLNDCPPGLFRFGETLGFKSEYVTTLENPRRYQCDAYVVESGEYFQGGAVNSIARGQLLVSPLPVAALAQTSDRAGAVRVPDGWALVPIKPTEAMVNAAVVPLNRTGSVRSVWSAMLAATTSVPAISEDAGWKLVPMVMTAAMANAWSHGETFSTDENAARSTNWQDSWKRLLAAAPTVRAISEPIAMTAEEHRLEDLKQMAAYTGPIVSFDVREPYYLASCDRCGWVGSSELCGTDSGQDDSDVYCPRCQTPGADWGKVAERLATRSADTCPDTLADEYAAEYVMSTEGNDYVPTEWERELIDDALHGFIADHWPKPTPTISGKGENLREATLARIKACAASDPSVVFDCGVWLNKGDATVILAALATPAALSPAGLKEEGCA